MFDTNERSSVAVPIVQSCEEAVALFVVDDGLLEADLRRTSVRLVSALTNHSLSILMYNVEILETETDKQSQALALLDHQRRTTSRN